MPLKIFTSTDEDKLIENIQSYFEIAGLKYKILYFSTCSAADQYGSVSYSLLIEHDEPIEGE